MKTFEEFWPFYLSQHSKPRTRMLHLVGTNAGLVVALFGAYQRRWGFLAEGLVIGYLFAWIGHFFVEKNKPATWTYPLMSFRADWKLWALAMTGRLPAELDRQAPAIQRHLVGEVTAASRA